VGKTEKIEKNGLHENRAWKADGCRWLPKGVIKWGGRKEEFHAEAGEPRISEKGGGIEGGGKTAQAEG